MAIIGTAGHVDHGKSTLVRALTGIDPDRLEEEKRRGMTIDLGFAHLDLPGGERVGIVDVPGHARFVHNMLAGVHGMDAVLLVVAADEGVMAQTREHLDILRLLEVERMVVALTKTDLVDAEWSELVTAEVEAELGRRGVSAPVIPVSAPAGLGLERLGEALRAALPPPAIDRGLPRLPVDRAFVAPGFGLVVTGSLVDGSLRVGSELEVVPPAQGRAPAARVRGLQQHGRAVDSVAPGGRVAVNLQGLQPGDVRRGQVLAARGTVRGTRCVDVRLVLLDGAAPLRHDAAVVFHGGTAEVQGRVRILEADRLAPGAEAYVQVRLAEPIALRDGDRFVIRRPSPAATVGGGVVVDVAARPHRRRQAGVVDSLRARTDLRGRLVEDLRRSPGGLDARALAAGVARPAAEVEAALAELEAGGLVARAGPGWLAAETWVALRERALAVVAAQHRAHPLRPGMPREALRGSLKLAPRGPADVIEALVDAGVLEAPRPDLVALPGFTPLLAAAQEQVADAVLAAVGAEPLSPPPLPRLRMLGLDDELLAHLEEQGRVVRVAPELVMLPAAVRDAEARLRLRLADGGAITVAEARDVLGSSRRTVVPLLEHFDAAHVTVRDGDRRRLRPPRPA